MTGFYFVLKSAFLPEEAWSWISVCFGAASIRDNPTARACCHPADWSRAVELVKVGAAVRWHSRQSCRIGTGLAPRG